MINMKIKTSLRDRKSFICPICKIKSNSLVQIERVYERSIGSQGGVRLTDRKYKFDKPVGTWVCFRCLDMMLKRENKIYEKRHKESVKGP